MTNNEINQTALQEFWGKISLKLSFEQIDEFVPLFYQAKEIEKEQSNAKINIAIKEFETLKSKANSLKDVVYLDGVLAVLDSIKNKTYGGDKQ